MFSSYWAEFRLKQNVAYERTTAPERLWRYLKINYNDKKKIFFLQTNETSDFFETTKTFQEPQE